MVLPVRPLAGVVRRWKERELDVEWKGSDLDGGGEGICAEGVEDGFDGLSERIGVESEL